MLPSREEGRYQIAGRLGKLELISQLGFEDPVVDAIECEREIDEYHDGTMVVVEVTVDVMYDFRHSSRHAVSFAIS